MDKETLRKKWRELKALKEKRTELSAKIKSLHDEIDEEIDPGPQQKLPFDKKPPKKRKKR